MNTQNTPSVWRFRDADISATRAPPISRTPPGPAPSVLKFMHFWFPRRHEPRLLISAKSLR